MPGKVKVRIISGRNLPVMDRSSDTTDAYVEIKLGSTTYKTDVCRKSLHPQWNSEWYRFEVDDSELQDEPLQIRLMDHDTYSANDAIGKVYLDLNPLLLPASGNLVRYGWNGEGNVNLETPANSVMSGWIPVYDTMHGIRGEVNVIVKVELFSDFNRFRQSSCGVQFFVSPSIPHGYYAQIVHGFVEELVVNDDPEYQWIDKIRTPRASNEARQTLFFKLSGELQRKIGVKALDLGGNAVIGYTQCFDLEGESGIVARGIGTAVTLVKLVDVPHPVLPEISNEERAKSYLKFLGSSANFSLVEPNKYRYLYPKKYNVNPINSSLYHNVPHPHQHPRPRHIKSRSSPTLSESGHHHPSVRTLLKQEDMRGTPGTGISQRFKNFKYSSRNILSNKMIALKAKISDTGSIGEEADELKYELAQIKQKKPFPFQRTVSDSNVMAELLARSVIKAHNSLTCILESQDNSSADEDQVSCSESVTPDTLEELEPIANLLGKTVSEPYLSLPHSNIDDRSGEGSMTDSNSNSSDDDFDDNDDDDYNKESTIDFDTVSNIIKNVKILEKKNKPNYNKQYSLPFMPQSESTSMSYSIDDDDGNSYYYPQFINSDDGLDSTEALETEELLTYPIGQFTGCYSTPDLADHSTTNVESNVETSQTLQETTMDEKSVPEIVEKRSPNRLVKQNSFETDELQESKEEIMNLERVENSFHESENPPLAQFDIFDKEDDKISEPDLTNNTTTENLLQVPPDKESETKLIIPPVMIGANISHQGLVRTAMQTMLLEKVNIIGTYTPPVSPTLVDSKTQVFTLSSPLPSTNSSPLPVRSVNSNPARSITRMGRSSTAVSLADYYGSKTDTVLGAPFTSIKRRLSHPCMTTMQRESIHKKETVLGIPFQNIITPAQFRKEGFSDSELNKPITDLESILNKPLTPKEDDNIIKNKSKFFNILGKTSTSNIPKGLSQDHLNKRFSFFRRKSHEPSSPCLKRMKSTSSDAIHNKKRFSFLHRSRKSSESEAAQLHESTKEKSRSVISGIFHKSEKNKEQRSSSVDTSNFKKHGLVGTALGNVVMETVQDILATSHSEKRKKKQNMENKSETPPIFPSSSILPKTNNTNEEIENNKQKCVDIANNTLSDNLKIKPDNSMCDNNMHGSLTPSLRNNTSPLPDAQIPEPQTHQRTESVGAKIHASPAKLNSIPCIHRRSSDSDLSITPKGNSLTGSDRSGGGPSGHFMRSHALFRANVHQDNFDMLEYPFLTMSKYPHGFIVQIGGAVSARSVKLLERISNIEEPESRDTWWSELRMEIRSHARALNCNSVLGYSETTSICEDVCVLSASGTAAVIGFHYSGEMGDNVGGLPMIPKPHFTSKDIMTTSLDRSDIFDREKLLQKDKESTNTKTLLESPEHENLPQTVQNNNTCILCHLPYNSNNIPVRANTLKCFLCRVGKVPDVLIATIEMPDGIVSIGRGCFIQSYVCRPLKDLRGESNAKEISDGLPFLEYELHRILVNKLKIKGMNAIFGLKIKISIGEKMLIGIATGTASYLAALPAPVMPKLVSDRTTDPKKLSNLQKDLQEIVRKNKEIYQLKDPEDLIQNGRVLSDNDDSEEEQSTLELSVGNKDCCILEVDDPEDEEVVHLIMEGRPPDGFHVVNTEFVPGLQELEIVKNLQMFTQIYRAKLTHPYNLDIHFHRLLQTVYFKLRRMVPCALCDLQFRVDLPEPDEIQLCVLGMALGLGEQKPKIKRRTPTTTSTKKNDEDLIFNLEDDQNQENSIQHQNSQNLLTTQNSTKHRQKSPLRTKTQTTKQRHMPYKERHGVDITPLSYVPGGKIERYLGNLNFFFIRETTSIREEGGLSGFIHSFVTEVLAIVRAHVTALGGNAMVAYFMTECVLNHNLHKNQFDELN